MDSLYDKDDDVKQVVADQLAEEDFEEKLSEMFDREALDQSQANKEADFDINAAIRYLQVKGVIDRALK